MSLRRALRLISHSHPTSPPWTTIAVRSAWTFYEPNRRSGWKDPDHQLPWHEYWGWENVKKNWKLLWSDTRKQLTMWRKEWKEWFLGDAIEFLDDGDVSMIFDFRAMTTAQAEEWIVTSDSDYRHGKSTGKMSISQQHTCVFTGNLDHEPVADGYTKAAGYVNIRSPYKQRSFHREDTYFWKYYTHFVIKFRGDGRTYAINLNTRGHFDVNWNDLYNYPLYTRGGPYWQIERIPFSKFLFTHKGRIQDKQEPIDLERVCSISFTAHRWDGPFRLEIDYIAVEYDENWTEEFAYELYAGRMFEN